MMKIIDRLCQVVGGLSALLIAVSMLYVIVRVIATNDIGRPPVTMWVGLFGVIATMLIYFGAHVIKGDI